MNKPRLLLTTLFCLASINLHAASFMGGEHLVLGAMVKLKTDQKQPARNDLTLTLTNGAKVTYGEIIALGDHYGVEDAPIFQGATLIEREQRFTAAFNTLDLDENAGPEIPRIIDVLNQELSAVEAAVTKGIPAHKAYREISIETARQINCLTGGGCDPNTWWMKFGRSMKLASTDFDHFGDAAWLAYEAGHHMAMRIAVVAQQTGQIEYLYRAYAMNALASHYLLDRYASGHIRTPRLEFVSHVTPVSVGNLIMRYMHDEENAGLNVHNAAGDKWRAIGDGFIFEEKNNAYNQFVLNALQQSADEIYTAYESGQIIENQQPQLNKLPIADETHGVCKDDIAQMFIWDELSQQLLRRENLSDKHACKWTSNWWGWSTLLELRKIGQDDLTIPEQAQLAQTIYAHDAVKIGLISDKNIIRYVQTKH